jgi:hypothetical protein
MKKQSTCGVFFGRVKNEKERKKEKEKKNLVKGEVEPRLAKKRFVSSLSLSRD